MFVFLLAENAEKKRLEAAQAAVVAREQLKLQKKMEKEKRRFVAVVGVDVGKMWLLLLMLGCCR